MCSIVNGLRRLTKGLFYGAILLALPALAQRRFDTDILADTFGFDADNQSSAIHVPVRLFWFSWFTFYPETDLVK